MDAPGPETWVGLKSGSSEALSTREIRWNELDQVTCKFVC